MSARAVVICLSVFFCLCVTCVLSQSYYSPAGLKIRTKEDAFNKMLKSIPSSVFGSEKSIPDESGSLKMSFLGSVDYKMTNIKVTNFKQPDVRVTIKPDKISLDLTVAGFTLLANWTYQWFGLSDSGTVNVTVTASSVNVSLAVGFDSFAGRPTVSVAACSATVSNVAVRLSGDASRFYNLFSGIFAKFVEGKVRTNVCAQFRRGVDVEAAAAMASLPLQWDLGSKLVVDLRLVSAPTLGNGYVETLHKGTVYDRNNPVMPPIQPGPFPATDESKRLLPVSLWTSEFVPGSYLYARYSRGDMRSTITPSTLPSSMKSFLNTTCSKEVPCIGNLFPQIASKYPNSVLEAGLAVAGPPVVSISPSGLQIVIAVNLMVRARRADGSLAVVFNAVIGVNMSGSISWKSSEIKVEVSRIQPNVTSVTDSTVGTINNNDLSNMLESLAKQYLQTKKIEKGFPIPDFIRWKDVEVHMLNKCVLITGDIEPSP